MMKFIADENGMRAFALHLVNEFAVESIKFYEEVTLWKKGTTGGGASKYANIEAKLSWAKLIYDSYLKPSSVLQLNISSLQQEKIDHFFELPMQNSEEFSQQLDDVFNQALKESVILMTGSWPRFIQSKLYKDYMTGNTTNAGGKAVLNFIHGLLTVCRLRECRFGNANGCFCYTRRLGTGLYFQSDSNYELLRQTQ